MSKATKKRNSYKDKMENPGLMMYGPTKHANTHRTKDSYTPEKWGERSVKLGLRHRFSTEDPKKRLTDRY